MNGSPGFYRFLGLHSLLIGLFPFFIPVWLWSAGFSLASISLFIALSGVSFCCFIRVWETSAAKLSLPAVMALTLLLELLLLTVCLGLGQQIYLRSQFLLLLALANGLYNCFFWTTQRALFIDLISSHNAGRQYGNFQIFVMVFLKVGILIGGFLLENSGFLPVLLLSAAIVLAAVCYLWQQRNTEALEFCKPVTWREIRGFGDSCRSRLVFLLDGLFLFLESHFWTISLFLLAEQNFARLGLVVIVLAVLFSLVFFIVKNTIDRIAGARLYQLAAVLYALGWWLRPALSHSATEWLLVLLLLITFFTSFFRLAFNKRFYDTARGSGARRYLLIKSYYTQFSAALVFTAIAVAAAWTGNDLQTLQFVYLAAGLLALAYLLYRPLRAH